MICQPSALFLIKKELGNKVELRFYNDKERSFHPKSYIFHYENMSEIYIGSSNLTVNALKENISKKEEMSAIYKGFFQKQEDISKRISDLDKERINCRKRQ